MCVRAVQFPVRNLTFSIWRRRHHLAHQKPPKRGLLLLPRSHSHISCSSLEQPSDIYTAISPHLCISIVVLATNEILFLDKVTFQMPVQYWDAGYDAKKTVLRQLEPEQRPFCCAKGQLHLQFDGSNTR